MKSNTVFLITLLLFLTVHTQTVAENNSLGFEISGIKHYAKARTTEFGSSFVITSSVEVINPTNANISFDYPDSCCLKTNVTYFEHHDWDSVYHHGCFQAVTTVEYPPGTTNTTADGWINFPDETTPLLPDGRYKVSLQFANLQEVDYSTDIGFVVKDGMISVDPNFSEWRYQNPTASLDVQYIEVIMVLVIITGFNQANRLCKSRKCEK